MFKEEGGIVTENKIQGPSPPVKWRFKEEGGVVKEDKWRENETDGPRKCGRCKWNKTAILCLLFLKVVRLVPPDEFYWWSLETGYSAHGFLFSMWPRMFICFAFSLMWPRLFVCFDFMNGALWFVAYRLHHHVKVPIHNSCKITNYAPISFIKIVTSGGFFIQQNLTIVPWSLSAYFHRSMEDPDPLAMNFFDVDSTAIRWPTGHLNCIQDSFQWCDYPSQRTYFTSDESIVLQRLPYLNKKPGHFYFHSLNPQRQTMSPVEYHCYQGDH